MKKKKLETYLIGEIMSSVTDLRNHVLSDEQEDQELAKVETLLTVMKEMNREEHVPLGSIELPFS